MVVVGLNGSKMTDYEDLFGKQATDTASDTVFHFPFIRGRNSEADDLGGEGAAVAES